MSVARLPAGPIRLSVPVTELGWHRHSWLLVPLMILAVYSIIGLALMVGIGFDAFPVVAFHGFGVAVCVAVLTCLVVRADISGLCEVATLYRDRIVLMRDGREISLQWGDIHSVRSGWVGRNYWGRYPVQLRCRVNGRNVRLCFYPRMDPEFAQWGLGSPLEALYMLSGRKP